MPNNSLSVILQNLILFFFVVLITLSPSIHFIPYIDFHDCQRVIQLILLCLVLINSIYVAFNKTEILSLNKYIRTSFYSLIALALVSTALSKVPRYAIIEITIFIALYYLSLFVAMRFRENKELFIKQLMYVIWASILLYMVSFYVGYTTAMVFKKPLNWPYPFYGFSNIRLFQQYQLWSLALICLPLLAYNLKKNTQVWLYMALSCWWILLYYAASRGVMLSWIVGMITTSVIFKKIAWPFLRIQCINAASGLTGYWLLFKTIPSWIANSSEASGGIVTSTIFRDTTWDRIALWKASLSMISEFPFLGVGPMHFHWYTNAGTHPHNSVLQLAAEFGLPATLIILSIASYGFYCWLKKFNPNKIKILPKLDSNLAVILLFTLIANGSYSLVEGVIVMPISQTLMFTVIGLMLGQYFIQVPLHAGTNIKSISKLKPVFICIVLIAMIWSVLPEMVRGLTSYDRYFQLGERAFSMAPDTVNPRIWMQQRKK